ncbi:MAG: iron-siderophore ABC transporter substrate-binding protein [Cyanobacteria bacterium P01_F01_bin.13]
MIGWLAVGTLLASCQSGSVTPSTTESTRPIEHAMGTTEIPVSPQRVVVLDTAPLDTTLALGITPVGTAVYGQPPKYLGDRVKEIEIIGDANQPNLETILSLKPDLILGSKIGAEEQYSQLSQIAPTVLTEDSGRAGDSWQTNLRLYGEALGRAEQAEQLLQDYRQRVQQLQTKVDQPQALTISVLIVAKDVVRGYAAGSFSGAILQDIGFSRPPVQNNDQEYALQLSPEALDTLDGDYIFLIYSTYRPRRLSKAEFVSDPIWSQLNAVKQDRVCQVNSEVWIAGRSVLAANQILTEIEACFESGEVEPSKRVE